MLSMGKKRKKPKPAARKMFPMRLRDDMRAQLELLAARNASTVTAEIVRGIVRLLTEEGLWPNKKE